MTMVYYRFNLVESKPVCDELRLCLTGYRNKDFVSYFEKLIGRANISHPNAFIQSKQGLEKSFFSTGSIFTSLVTVSKDEVENGLLF